MKTTIINVAKSPTRTTPGLSLRLLQIWSLSSCLLLSGCGSLIAGNGYHNQPNHLTWAKREQQLSTLTTWQLNAAASIRYRKVTNIVYLDWQNSENQYVIDVAGPFNLNASAIRGNKNQVTLWQNNKKITTALTPEELLQKELGFYLPISNLVNWIKALPNTNVPYHATFDKYNHLATLTQQHWQIRYDNFKDIDGIDLPKNIWLDNDELDIHIKIVNRDWRF